jgi:hypothetical protein
LADKKISQLPNLTGANLANDDEFVFVDTSVDETKAITYGELSGRFTSDIDAAVVSAEVAQAAAEDAQAGAEAAEANTIFIFDQFGDQYLGPKASDPTVDNDGDPLTEGDIYFNTTDDVLKFYSGTAWVAPESIATTAANEAEASATAAATSESNAASSETAAALSETNALSYVADTEAARDQSQDARDTANLHKLAAEAAATSATNTAAALTGFDLEAIAESKAVTAVDVFVYDTSKDSDGGAWRKRTQHTSWYNETLNTATRGSRREFPAVAVIVAEAAKVTIYDGDDPSLPMWMVFNASTDHSRLVAYGDGGYVSCVSMLNGILFMGTYSGATNGSVTGLSVANFVADSQSKYDETGYIKSPLGLYDRNDNTHGLWWHSILPRTASQAVVSQYINDVAMTVLPDAPIDPATGLPVPTIAVATNGGVSVIKDDGTVVDSSLASAIGTVDLFGDTLFWARHDFSNDVVYATKNIGTRSDGFGASFTIDKDSPAYLRPLTNNPDVIGLSDRHMAVGASGVGLQSILLYTTDANSMIAYTTSTYNTGWMNGNIKGAFLSDTDDTDLVGSGELVDWNTGVVDTDFAILNATTLSLDGTQSQNDSASISSALSVGKSYVWTVTVSNYVQGQIALYWNGTSAGTKLSSNGTTVATYVATGTSITLQDREPTPFIGDVSVSVKLADADRSVNNKGLIVNGTVTRTAVATGADLVAYSGFSAANYLEQPYNSALDFGTGDFCVMGWVKHGTSATQCIAMRQDPSALSGFGSGASYRFQVYAGNVTMSLPTSSLILSYPTANVGWVYLTWLRRNSVMEIYANGKFLGSAVNTDSLTNTSAITRVGVLEYNGSLTDAFIGSLALLRISATAPTAEQIAKIYNDEKVLFQENAQATLYGSSDAVTALAHDSDTNLLHVGTSAGRSVFQGLRRVSNTTTAVGTAISASNGLVVEE